MFKQELIKLFKAAIFCICLCVIIALGEAVLLRTPLLAGMKAFLYRLLVLDALCCVALLAAAAVICARKKTLFGLELSAVIMCIGLSTLFMALFLSLGPMPIERSYTIYSLANMADSAEPVYSFEDIKTQFIDGFIEDANETQKRIDEQVSIGNLEETDGGYRITEKGERLIRLLRFVEAVFPVPDETCIYPNKK